jgi:hypothetical protein
MAKTVTIVVEDDELDLLKTIGSVTDFYSDGYDDMLLPGARESEDVFNSFMDKLEAAFNAVQ